MTTAGGSWVTGGSDIKSWEDVKPSVIICMETGKALGSAEVASVLDWAGLDEEDAVIVPAHDADGLVELMIEAKSYICPSGPSTSAHIYRAAAGSFGIRYLEMDPKKEPERAERYSAVRPEVMFLNINSGVEAAIGVTSVAHPYFYAADTVLDTDLVYHLVKWLDENFDAYKDRDYRCAEMGIESFAELLEVGYTPAHDGVKKYFKDKGLWTSTHWAVHDYNLEVVTNYIEAFNNAIAEADEKGIMVDPTNQVWIDFWKNYKKEVGAYTLNTDYYKIDENHNKGGIRSGKSLWVCLSLLLG